MSREVIQEVVEKYTNRLHQLFADKDFTIEVLDGKPRFLNRQKQVLEYVDLNENNILINALKNNLPFDKVCVAIQKTGDIDLFLKLLRHKNLEGESVKSLLGKNYKAFCKYMKEGIAKYSNLE